MATIQRDIEIQAGPEQVFEELINWRRLSHWSTVTVEHSGPDRCSAVGEEFDQKIRVAGVPLQTHWRVVEFDAPRLVAYEVTATGGGRMSMRQSVAPSGGGSRVVLASTTTCREDSSGRHWTGPSSRGGTSARSSTRCRT